MKTYRYWIVAVVISVTLYMMVKPVEGASLIYKEYPYWVFGDGDVVRYCMDPAVSATHTVCWTDGKSQSCRLLPPELGYISDCKDND